MFSSFEQFSTTTKAHYEAQLAMLNALTHTAFDGFTKMVDLNVNVAKATLAESTVVTKKVLSAKDPQEFFALTAAHAQPTAEKALAYGRHFASIASSTQAEFTKAAEAKIAETHRNVMALMEVVVKNAPAGSEHAMALVKSAIGTANDGYQLLTKTTQQAVGALEGHLSTAANQFSQAVEKTVSGATKK